MDENEHENLTDENVIDIINEINYKKENVQLKLKKSLAKII